MKKSLCTVVIGGMTAVASVGLACRDTSGSTQPAEPTRAGALTTEVRSPAELTQPTVLPAESAMAFDAFPIYWLGESYDSDGDGAGDQELVGARPEQEAAFLDSRTGQQLHPAIRSFAIAYGHCTIPAHAQSCPVPITLIFYPPDSAPVPDEVRSSIPSVNVRGIAATVYNGGALWLETADVTLSIDVFAATPDEKLNQAVRIAKLLVGANAKAKGVSPGSAFVPKQ